MNNLDIKIKREPPVTRVTISASIEIVLSCMLISSIEKAFRDAFIALARNTLGQFLRLLDNLLLEEKQKKAEICRLINRSFITILGEINFNYRQAKRNGKYFSPLPQLLGMLGISKKQKISDGVREEPVKASIFTSFRKALKICRSCISLSTLWNSFQEKGRYYRSQVERAIYYYSEGEPLTRASIRDFAVVMIDEIWIMRRKKKSWHLARTAKLKVARFVDGKYEFLPVCAYSTPDGKEVLRFLSREGILAVGLVAFVGLRSQGMQI